MLLLLSIHAKISNVIAILLIAMSFMGLFAIFQIRTIDQAAASDISLKAPPTSQALAEVRADSNIYRSILRRFLLAENNSDREGQIQTLQRQARSIADDLRGDDRDGR